MIHQQEIWANISDFPDYQISTGGNVRKSATTGISRWGTPLKLKAQNMAINKDTYGYLFVSLTNKRGRFKPKVHRLVAKSFIDNPENKKEVNHINSNREDNRLENLEWCTPMENVHHSIKMGRWVHLSKLNTQDVLEVRRLFKEKKLRICELAKIYKVNRVTIGEIVNNKKRIILHQP